MTARIRVTHLLTSSDGLEAPSIARQAFKQVGEKKCIQGVIRTLRMHGSGHDENVKHPSEISRRDPKPQQVVTRCSQMLSIRRIVVKKQTLQNGYEGVHGSGHDET